MKRNDAQQVGLLIRKFLRQESLEAPLNETRLINSWGELMGPMIVSYTKELFIKNQTLFVRLSSPALRQELFSVKRMIMDKLNARVGAQVITDIVFH